MHQAYNRGLQYARYHNARPCLGTLEHGWSLSAADALHFAVGYSERCRELGKPIKIICQCKARGEGNCSSNEESAS